MSGGSVKGPALEEILRRGSKSFHLASRFLPARLRPSVLALYAFCRQADDMVDDAEKRDAKAAVARLRARIERVYAGEPSGAIEEAFASVVRAHGVPRAVLDALAEGMAWDADGKVYETFDDTVAYAVRVAGTVGVAMTVLMTGDRSEALLGRAVDLGVAMQLTNISRDVGEDARNGRVYLPTSWIGEGARSELMRAPRPSDPVRQATARLLVAADRIYQRAEEGIDRLPADCRTAIRAAARVYHGIGEVVRARDFDSVTVRAVVPMTRKLRLAGEAVGQSRRAGHARAKTSLADLTLPQARFLVSAAAP